MYYLEFKHGLGIKARSLVYGITGTVVSRSQSLYGCNRYYIQPAAGADNKVPEGYWVDEDDVEVLPEPSTAEHQPSNRGGPASTIR